MCIQDQVQLMLSSTHDVPTSITFSPDGYMRAMMEDDKGAFCLSGVEGKPTTYLGMPVHISETLQGPFQLDYGKQVGHVTMEINGATLLGGINVFEVIGATLSAAEVCDLIQGFLENDDPSAWGPFEKALHKVITEHGTFE